MATAEMGATIVPFAPRSKRSEPVAPLRRGDLVGRYMVLEALGEGGMGVVYAAYDPQLDRKVAIKLIRTKGEDAAQAQERRTRLLREAQALARLQHPNVVAVHDVGLHDDQIFMALECIQGVNLEEWLQQPRRWQEILAVMLQAGRGLEAAHAVGLVHRDFKSRNVLVGDDGRVRVVDFGLARLADASAPPSATALPSLAWDAEEPVAQVSAGSLLGSGITKAGALIGTPGYMAPEQLLQQATSVRGDQYSFCVTLFRALYGKLPFGGKGLREHTEEVLRGNLVEVPADSPVPEPLRRLVLRGLNANPELRFPSMAALLEALEPPRVRRRGWLALAALVLVSAVVALSSYRVVRQKQTLCDGGSGHWVGLWDGQRQAAMTRAFAATKLPFAGDIAARVSSQLDRYLVDWTAMHQSACEATHLRGEQSDKLLDLRMGCLWRRLESAREQVDVLMTADRDLVLKAVTAVQSLPPVSDCANTAALGAPLSPPSDPEVVARIAELSRQQTRAQALYESGKAAAAAALLRPAVVAADQLGYRPLEASLWLTLGQVEEELGDFDASATALHRATRAAIAGHDDLTAADADSMLALVLGHRQSQTARGAEVAEDAQAFLARFGSEVPKHLRANVLNRVGLLAYYSDRNEEALPLLEKAYALAVAALGPEHARTLGVRGNLALVLAALDRDEESLREMRQAVAIIERVQGRFSLAYAFALNQLCSTLAADDQLDEAAATCERSRALLQVTSPEHPLIVWNLNAEATILLTEGRLDEALQRAELALAFAETHLGHDHAQVVQALATIAHVERGRHQRRRPRSPR